MRFSDGAQAPAATLPCTLRDHPDWHRGRARYWLWSIPVDCPPVLQRLQAARALLGDWLHAPGARQAHITLFVCGFPAQSPQFDDDFPATRLAAQLDALRRLRAAPFVLRIRGLRSFASAPYLTVDDPDASLAPLRAVLAAQGAEIRQAPYRPHLTVGRYACAVAHAELQRRLAASVDHTPLNLPVRELHYATYAAADLAGPLRCERRLALD